MHFFEKQRVDAIGYMGVSLQKSVIFLMVVSMVVGVLSGNVLSGILSVAFLFTAFWGAYKRRTCLLAIYFWINVIAFVLGLVACIALIMIVPAVANNDSSTGTVSADVSSGPSSNAHIHRLVSSLLYIPHVSPSNSTSTISPASNTTIIPDPNPTFEGSLEYQTGVSVGALVVISFVAVVFSVLVLFFKIYSVILSWKLRKLIIASRPCSSACSSAPVCSSAPATPEDSKPLINPGYPASSVNGDVQLSVFPEQNAAPQQAQPMMYMPYPYFNPMQGQNYPMMFNQNGQPIFYSYQPMAPQQGAQL
jgi:hypothetical protein